MTPEEQEYRNLDSLTDKEERLLLDIEKELREKGWELDDAGEWISPDDERHPDYPMHTDGE